MSLGKYVSIFIRHGSNLNSAYLFLKDMEVALDCLKEGRLSLTRASEMFKIPATTLWQRANKLGIATPKKGAQTKLIPFRFGYYPPTDILKPQ